MGADHLSPHRPSPALPDGPGDDGLESAIARLRGRRWLLLGVGNDLRGDDAFGPLLARRLRDAGLPAIDGGSAPENVTGAVRRAAPDVLLLADAADLGAAVGEVRLLPAEALAEGGTSTHDPSLRMLLDYLRADLDVEVRALCCQPGRRTLGAAPSPEVRGALERLGRAFEAASPPHRP